MPYLVPYGGVSWTLACLLPPSSISLFASVLLKMEVDCTLQAIPLLFAPNMNEVSARIRMSPVRRPRSLGSCLCG